MSMLAEKLARRIRVALGEYDDPDKPLSDLVSAMASELTAHRAYLEHITDGGTEYDESCDKLVELGLIVEVPPTQEFIDEWGDDQEMWVLAWQAMRALAAGKDGE